MSYICFHKQQGCAWRICIINQTNVNSAVCLARCYKAITGRMRSVPSQDARNVTSLTYLLCSPNGCHGQNFSTPFSKGCPFAFFHSSEIKLSFFKAPQSSVFNHIMAFPLKAWPWLQGLGSKTKPCLSISTHNLYNSWCAVRDGILYHPPICLPHCQILTLKRKISQLDRT